MNKLHLLLAVVVGGVVGALATYAITKKSYEDELRFELDEMSEYYKNREIKLLNDFHAASAETISEIVEGVKEGLETGTEDVRDQYDDEKAVIPPLTERLNRDKASMNPYKRVVQTIDYSKPKSHLPAEPSYGVVDEGDGTCYPTTEAPSEYFEPKSDQEMGPEDGYETDEDTEDNSDYDEKRAPFLINEETFMETHLEWPKVTITLYSDGVLLDEDETIMNISDTIGQIPNAFNYDFGNVAFVRNLKLMMDYEIARVDTRYSEVVAGFGRLPD